MAQPHESRNPLQGGLSQRVSAHSATEVRWHTQENSNPSLATGLILLIRCQLGPVLRKVVGCLLPAGVGNRGLSNPRSAPEPSLVVLRWVEDW